MRASTILLLALVHSAFSQSTDSETIWSSVVVTLYGDRIPLLSPELSILTPLGAQDLYDAGALFRQRYIAPSNGSGSDILLIDGISPFEIDNIQVLAQSLLEIFVLQSAQAFLQGLYPPVDQTPNNATLLADDYLLSNGSSVQYPLNGYQYPQLYTTSDLDPNSIWLSGENNCQSYTNAETDYLNSEQFEVLENATLAFYERLEPGIFEGTLPLDTLDYGDAYLIYDYLSYGYIHNETIQSTLSLNDLTQAKDLADQYEFAVNGNRTFDGGIGTISGQTLATFVLTLLISNIDYQGEANKLNLLFTTFEPMIALASLLDLPPLYSQFYGVPLLGSSMVFEMFSFNGNTSSGYPAPADLNVRFLFRNGTTSTENLDAYPLWALEEGAAVSMTFDSFVTSMEGIMVANVSQWCTMCNSNTEAIFCPFYTNVTGNITTGGSASGPLSGSAPEARSGMKPAIAGVIGAVIALGVAAFILVAAILLFGIRFHRETTKRRSALGGFKGSEKRASDPDLSLVKGTGVGAAVIPKGHERVGSWELKNNAGLAKDIGGEPGGNARRPSFETDHDILDHEPVRVDEAV